MVIAVGVNNATNAALSAARILAVEDDEIRAKLDDYVEGNAKESLRRDQELQDMNKVED